MVQNIESNEKHNLIKSNIETPIENDDGGAVRGASFLIAVQFSTKLFTFALNQILVRFISPEIFGVSAYLEFIVSTILFFSREGIRVAVQRLSLDEDHDHNNKQTLNSSKFYQSIINLGFLPIFISVPITLLLIVWQVLYGGLKSGLLGFTYHNYTLSVLGISLLSELLVEPIYLLNQFLLNFKRRSQIEGLAIFGRCVATFLSIVFVNTLELDSKDFSGAAIISFAIGQLTYSLTLLIGYLMVFFLENVKSPDRKDLKLSIQKITYESNEYFYFHPKAMKTWSNLFTQMIFKQLLTEGDKFLVNYFFTIGEQGVYSVMSNYGSIAARLIFQPIEESIRLLFSRSLSSSVNKQNNVEDSFTTMRLVSLFYFNLSILIILSGTTNASFLLSIVLGRGGTSKWHGSNIFDLFPQYVAYLPFLAFNGIFEAIFSSIATNSEIRKFSVFMTTLTITCLAVSYILIEHLNFGLSGLIISNALNMTMRIGYCAIKIKKYYEGFNIKISAQETYDILQNTEDFIILDLDFDNDDIFFMYI
ncbi:flippase [Scheffersomyces amazonensis]|uniref:flippase n=1 Tax=Scheffersomyces amazonensis TaxID=1078765 RepID=UPI00315D960D